MKKTRIPAFLLALVIFTAILPCVSLADNTAPSAAAQGNTESLKPISEVNALVNGFYAGYKVSTVTVKSAEPDKYSIRSFQISDDCGQPCSDNDRFEENRTYGIEVHFKPRSGYCFNESTGTLLNGSPTWPYGIFYESPTELSFLHYMEPNVKIGITQVSLTVPVPERGNKPADAAASSDAEGYKVSSTSWTPECSEFKGGTVYTATVVLRADNDYRFTARTTYLINGKKAEVIKDYWEKSTIAFTFAATEADPAPDPTAEPTAEPTPEPTAEPTAAPAEPTAAPEGPTAMPEDPDEDPSEPDSSAAGIPTSLVIVLAVIGGLLLIAIAVLIIVLIVRRKC